MKKRWWGVGIVVALALALFLYRCGREERPDGRSAGTSPSASSLRHVRRVHFGATDRQLVALMGAERFSTPGKIGPLEGVVLSRADDRPIAGAELVFGSGELFTVKSGADGTFRFEPPRAGVYELALASAKGHLPFAPEWGHSPLLFVARRGHGLRGARVYLTPAIEYAVVVIDKQGNPVAGAEVTVFGERAAGAALTSDAAPRRTNERGEASITAADYAVVEAQHRDHGRGRGVIDLSVQVSHRLVIRLGQELPARVALAGRVLDPDGTPLPDALVIANYEPDHPSSPLAKLMPGDRALSDEEGRFLLEVDEGRYVVAASATGFAAAVARDVQAPRKDLELRLTGGVSLFGRVTDEGGDPIPSFVVIVARPKGALAREIVTVEPTLDANGAYEIPTLPHGRFLVSVSAQGYAMAPDRSVELRDEPVEASFVLGRGGSIRGLVVDVESHDPLHRARVSVEGRYAGAAGDVPLLSSATTDEQGRFELTGVSAGPQSIFTAARDHHARVMALVVPSKGTVDVTVELTPLKEGETPSIELAGIGVELSAKDDVLVIGRIFAGGGGAEAGLLPGDAIVAVEGVSVVELGFEGAIQGIRGPEGTRVTLSVRKVGATEAIDIEVIRRRIRAS